MERLQHLLFLLILQNLSFAALSGEPAAFVSQPKSVNISEGENATFSCSGTPENIDITWRIDGTDLHQHNHRHITPHPLPETLAGGVKQFTLTVPGLAINDNIAIQCQLLPFLQASVMSDPAYLRVQGKPGVMQDVQLVQINNTTLQLSYTPPFTLVGVPINFFTITITSLDQATNVTINTTATELLYSPPNICTDYLLDITAWNRVDRGDSYLINTTVYRAPQVVTIHSMLAFSANTPIFIATFNIDTQCSGTQPDNITVALNNTDDNLEIVVFQSCPIRKHSIHCGNLVSISQTNTALSVGFNLSEHLTSGNHYTAVVALVNKGGATELKRLTINTFQVQRLSIGEFQSKDCATCVFAEETTATGCHIRFVDTTGNNTAKEIDAPRPQGTLSAIGCVGDLPPGVYRVLAFDISSSGVVDDRVAAVGESLVTVAVELTTETLSISQSPSMKVSLVSTTLLQTSTTMIMVDTTKPTQVDMVPLIATVTGISVLAAGVMIIMVACLVHYRAKARRHKIAEIYAKRKQKELEEAAVQSSHTQYPSSGNVLAGDPLYDEISANNKHVFATQPCPAYAPLPPPRE